MTLYPIDAGNFKLDGGAMFGVVPKSLWTMVICLNRPLHIKEPLSLKQQP